MKEDATSVRIFFYFSCATKSSAIGSDFSSYAIRVIYSHAAQLNGSRAHIDATQSRNISFISLIIMRRPRN